MQLYFFYNRDISHDIAQEVSGAKVEYSSFLVLVDALIGLQLLF